VCLYVFLCARMSACIRVCLSVPVSSDDDEEDLFIERPSIWPGSGNKIFQHVALGVSDHQIYRLISMELEWA